MLIVLFWCLLLAAGYSYFVYPLILVALSARGQKIDKGDMDAELPSTSLIIAAYNEKPRIREKIENTLSVNNDGFDLEIIVASDCSDDGTDDIVREFESQGVKLVRAEERLGKENAQLGAINAAVGDIIVFSDAATQIPPDSIVTMLRYFSDPSIGAVSSEDRFISNDGSVAGEGAYVKYEMWLRKQESAHSGLVGMSGSFFAARREVCKEWDILTCSDFNTALNCAKADLRAVSVPDVLGFYQDLKDPEKEYARKIRTVIRGMAGLARHSEVLNPLKFGFFAFQVWSHKLMRWSVPWFLIGLFIVNTLVATKGGIYLFFFLGQLGFYGLAIAAHFNEGLRQISAVKLIYFFVQVNVALFDAACQYFAGRRVTVWKPSAR